MVEGEGKEEGKEEKEKEKKEEGEEKKGKEDKDITEIKKYGLRIFQFKDKWRFSEDSIYLAEFVVEEEMKEEENERILEIGSGCGIISLIVGKLLKRKIVAVDIDKDMVYLSKKNSIENKIEMFIVLGDIRNYPFKSFDVIVSNPPYIPLWKGEISERKSKAKWEITLDLKTLVDTVSKILKNKGRCYVSYPVWRLGEVLSTFFKANLKPVALKFFHHSKNSKADFFIMKSQKESKKELEVLPPIIKNQI